MSYSIYKAEIIKNKKDILALWQDNSRGDLRKKYGWIFENNPAGVTSVWMVRHNETGKYVGMTSLFPRRFLINGESFVAGIAGDLIVNKSHRSVGPALMLQKSSVEAAMEGSFDFIYGFPNKAAEGVLKRSGFRNFGERVRLVKVLKFASKLSSLPKGKYIVFLGPFFDIFFKLFSLQSWSFTHANFVYQELEDFDERFDLLWREVNSNYPVIAERTSDYLKWKFIKDPNAKNKIAGIFDKDKKKLHGYIVFQHNNNLIEIRDYLFSKNKRANNLLLKNFFNNARKIGVDAISIELVKGVASARALKKYGFIERTNEGKAVMFFPNKIITNFPYIKEKRKWYLMQSDSDM